MPRNLESWRMVCIKARPRFRGFPRKSYSPSLFLSDRSLALPPDRSRMRNAKNVPLSLSLSLSLSLPLYFPPSLSPSPPPSLSSLPPSFAQSSRSLCFAGFLGWTHCEQNSKAHTFRATKKTSRGRNTTCSDEHYVNSLWFCWNYRRTGRGTQFTHHIKCTGRLRHVQSRRE